MILKFTIKLDGARLTFNLVDMHKIGHMGKLNLGDSSILD